MSDQASDGAQTDEKQTYSVQIEKLAWDELMAIPERMRERIFAALEALETEPRHARVTKLSGYDDLYRIRVGDYRIIYSIEDQVKIVLVEKVGHRSDVYR